MTARVLIFQIERVLEGASWGRLKAIKLSDDIWFLIG